MAEHVHLGAMDFQLETPFASLVHGETVNIVVRPMWIGDKSSLASSNIHGYSILTDLVLPNMPKVTIFDGKIEMRGNRWWVCKTPSTVLLGHPAIRDRDFQYMRESCAGIGAVSTGYAKCGVKTSVYNDVNVAFCQWLKQNGKKVIQGDINEIRVVKEMAQSPGMFLSAGIACQPFSKLGDERHQHDERSSSFTGTMTAGYLLQAQVYILECTPAVMTSEWVQGILQSFANQTGFKIQQQLLDLHTFWVSKRTRWWCTVSHPALNLQPIPSIPKMPFNPTFLHLFSKMMDIPTSDLDEIALDLYELRHFHGYPFLEKHLVDTYKTLPTATHSWGSQVKACSCGCRRMGFSHNRLEEKGLYGQLVLTGGEVMHGGQPYQKCRHLHACEIALANGLNPAHVGKTKGKCRLEIAGVGQMASPFQGAWVLANVLKDIHQHAFPLKEYREPMDVLQSMAQELLWARDKLLGYPKMTPSNEIFAKAIHMWGQSPALPAQVPQSTTDVTADTGRMETSHTTSEGCSAVQQTASEAGLYHAMTMHEEPTPIHQSHAKTGQACATDGHLTITEAKHVPVPTTHEDGTKYPKASEAGTAAIYPAIAAEAGSVRYAMSPREFHNATFGNKAKAAKDNQAGKPDRPTPSSGMHLPSSFAENQCIGSVASGRCPKASEAGSAAIFAVASEAGSVVHAESFARVQHVASGIPHDTKEAMINPKASDHTLPRNDVFQPDLRCKHTHPTPVSPQAKPLPRLGCGGPSLNVMPTMGSSGSLTEVNTPDMHAKSDMIRCLNGPVQPCSNFDLSRFPHHAAHGIKPNQPDHMQIDPTRPQASDEDESLKDLKTDPMTHPTRFHAMPLPRPGCGGPAQCDGHPKNPDMVKQQSEKTLSLKARSDIFLALYSEGQLGQSAMSHDAIPTERATEVEEHDKDHPAFADEDAITHAEGVELKAKFSEYMPPPTPFQAMPLPRLGCGGPSQIADDWNDCDPWMKAIQARAQVPMQADERYPNHASSGQDHAAQPEPLPHAMPPPRLGCGGPAHVNQDQTKTVGEVPTTAGSSEVSQPLVSAPSHVHPDSGGFHAFANPHVRTKNGPSEEAPKNHRHVKASLAPIKRLGETPINERQAKQQRGQSIAHHNPAMPASNATEEMTHQEKPATGAGIYDSPSQDDINRAILKHLESGHHDAPMVEESKSDPAIQHMATQLDQHESSLEAPKTEQDDLDFAVHVVTHQEGLMTHGMSAPCTTADLANALSRLGALKQPIRVSTAMGTQLSQYDHVKHNHFLLCEENNKVQTLQCPLNQAQAEVPDLRGLTREQALWSQKGWVADDEMSYYMHMLESYHPSSTFGVVKVPSNPDCNVVVTRTIIRALSQAGQDVNSSVKAIAFLCDHHWFPCVVEARGDEAKVYLPPHEGEWVTEAFGSMVEQHHVQFHSNPMPHEFHADCGFQTIGWILAKLMDDETTQPFTVRQACQWRSLYHQNLKYSGLADQTVVDLQLGGALNPREQLQQLIEAHGVHNDRSAECAEQIIQTLGLKAIQQILVSPKPWMDLKARANLHQPPIRIVTAEELKTAIQRRMKDPKQVGKKQNKIKNTKVTKPKMQLTADQVAIPTAVFRQEDGHELIQIYANQIGPNAMGVVLVSIEEAIPYFNLNSPVSQQGIALLIIDHDDDRLPPSCSVTKVPAKCIATNEPMIVSLAMMQIGAKQVARNLPAQCLEVPEVDNQVIRVQVYKDQANAKWDDFIQKPVKNLLGAHPFTEVASAVILDVWDRQYMTTRMLKVPVSEAQLFMVNLRVETSAIQTILSANGEEGKYFELRRSDGRQPDDAYQVVWLPGKTFAEAQVIQRTSQIQTALVRQGDRYGLRTDHANAEELHKLHRPDLVYIPGADLKKFKVGPMPFGTTKQSLVHVFQKWNWCARPIGPTGQASDRSGIMWSVQAATQPTHWVFQMAHGDVLVSPEDKEQVQPVSKPTVLASSKTIHSLQLKPKETTKEDPWLHNDPWRSPAGPSTRELSVGQVASIQANVEKVVLAKLRDDDDSMNGESDIRITALEQKLEQLTTQVSAQQHEQMQHNQQVQVQIQSLDMKIDQQQNAFQNALDNKLEQQMIRIEQLFTKRPRTGE
jgi:hypothetical protein